MLRLFAMIMVLALPAPALADRPPLPNELVAFIDSVLLHDDLSIFGSTGTVEHQVSRWDKPINVYVSADIPAHTRDRVWWHLDRVRALTGLEINPVEREAAANMRIIFIEGEAIRQLAGNTDTLCLTEYTPAVGAIDQADVYIPLEEAGWMDNCLAHELLHALGFYAHPKDNDNRSVLEQGAPMQLRTFTMLDAAALRVLYDPRLKSGLARERALPLVRTIVDELMAEWPETHPVIRPGQYLARDVFDPPKLDD